MSETIITASAPRTAAGIASFKNVEACRAKLHEEFGAPPPEKPGFIQCGAITLCCLTPTRFMALGPDGDTLAARLAGALTGLAAVTDQSGQWAFFELAGKTVRQTLAAIVPIDLTPPIFPVGALALTRAGHLDVRLWRLDDLRYEIAVTRSMAEDLQHLLSQSAGHEA